MYSSPVFIVGSPRSGTSILVDAMLSIGYHGFREGSFFPLIDIIGAQVDRQYKIFSGVEQVLISNVNQDKLTQKLFDVIMESGAELNPVSPWFDKTGNPEMIRTLPVLKRRWPSCRIIFAKRRGLENIYSRLKKFPTFPFQYHCSDWTRNMHAWRLVRDSLDPATYTEVDQQDLIRQPEEVVERIANLLSLDEPRKSEMVQTFKVNRPQQTQLGSAERILSIETIGWSPDQIELFKKISGEEMSAFKYSYGIDYYN